MQHANILTPSGFASVWECVFIPAAWVSLWIHFTSVTERCQLVYSRLGKDVVHGFYRGFCSLSRCPNLPLYAATTNRSRISDPDKEHGSNCHVSLWASAVWYAVLYSLFLTFEWRFLFSHLNGSCCRCEVWIYVFPSSRHDVNPQQK